MREALVDGLLQFGGTVECASTDHPFRDQCKEPFDLIQPRTAGRREVEVEAASAFRLEPTLNLCALVRAVVVHDQVDFVIGGKLSFQVVEEADELLAAVTVLTGSNHLSVEDIEGGKQCRGSVALVVVGLSLRQPWT